MKKFHSFIVLAFALQFQTLISVAQTTKDTIAGEYYLQGVMETASAILLKPDHKFEIYYSYGAVDRQGKGEWKLEDEKIVLNGAKWPKSDFSLSSSTSSPDSLTTVKITSFNQQILPFFEITIRTTDGDKSGKTDNEGVFQIPKSIVTAIELYFTLCPERFTTIPNNSDNNYFEFKTEPWFAEIFSEKILLNITKDGLKGEHPLLKGTEFLYLKAK